MGFITAFVNHALCIGEKRVLWTGPRFPQRGDVEEREEENQQLSKYNMLLLRGELLGQNHILPVAQ